MGWGDVLAAVKSALTGAGYTVSTVTEAEELPSHTAGTEVAVGLDVSPDGQTATARNDSGELRIQHIGANIAPAAALESAVTVAEALRVLLEADNGIPDAGARCVFADVQIQRLSGTNAVAARARYTLHILEV